jgi:hypothetical protein
MTALRAMASRPRAARSAAFALAESDFGEVSP